MRCDSYRTTVPVDWTSQIAEAPTRIKLATTMLTIGRIGRRNGGASGMVMSARFWRRASAAR